MANVIFAQGTKAKFNALASKDANTLYWLSDTQELYKGDILYGTGIIPRYEIEQQADADTGDIATYRMKVITGSVENYIGDTIHIPADKMLSEGSLKFVEAADYPYPGAEVGDPYLDLVLNDASSSHIYVPVKAMLRTIEAGDGIVVDDNTVSLKLNVANANGLKVTDDGLELDLASRTAPGAMSAGDKKFIDSIPSGFVSRKYAVVDGIFDNTLVSYENDEVRVMFPEGTPWHDQQVGTGGQANRYYFGLRLYAPAGAVSLIDWQAADKSDAEEKQLVESGFVHQDEFGRWYRVTWLPAAKKDENDVWSYFGAGSIAGKYIGWNHNIEWYDASGNLIDADMVRVNLSNEGCHTSNLPSYMNKYATLSDLEGVKATVEWQEI